MFDIIGIGESDVDLFLRVKQMPGRGEKVRGEEIGRLPGGIIGNFCSQASKTGVSVGIVSVVGDDENGRFILDDYEERGIDIAGIYVDKEEKTFYCVVFLDDSGEKYLTAVVTPLVSPSPDRIDYGYVKQAKYVHMCSMDYELVSAVVRELEGSGVKISLDYESHAQNAGWDHWKPVFEKVSVLFTNEEGMAGLFPECSLEEGSFRLLSLGIETLVVTCAHRGGYVFSGNIKHHYRAFAAKRIIDTTGAGDSFNAAFLSARIKGMDVREAADYAAAAASFVIQKEGARTGQQDDKAIRSFLESGPERIE
ncbi:carbohydrate kinase family protein [Lachnospiraceae bacterium 62-35]